MIYFCVLQVPIEVNTRNAVDVSMRINVVQSEYYLQQEVSSSESCFIRDAAFLHAVQVL